MADPGAAVAAGSAADAAAIARVAVAGDEAAAGRLEPRMSGAVGSRSPDNVCRARLPRAGQRRAGAGEIARCCRVGKAKRARYCARGRRKMVGTSLRSFAHPTKLEQALPVLVHRLALLDERRHALGAVFERKGRVEQIALDIHALRQRRLERAVDGLFGHRGCGPRHRGDLFGRRQRFFHQFVRRYDAADEAGALGFRRIHHASGEAQIHRLGFADRTRQPLGAADARDGAERDFGLAEFRGVGGNDDVAHHGEFAAAAERIAADGRDGGFAASGDAAAANRGEIAGEHVDEAFRLHLLDVGAGGECLFAAGEQDAADLVVGLEIVDGRRDLGKHAERQRVEHFRPVQRDDADCALALDNDVFERRHDLPRATIWQAMCPLPGWASSGAGREPRRVRIPDRYAMNMRAADASVSRAPKAIKTLPISDVLSSVELSLADASDDGLEVEAITTPCVTAPCVTVAAGCSEGGNDRSMVLFWSEATAPGSAGASASAGLSAAVCRTVLAFSDMAADMPLALSGGVSAAVICALALATHTGIAGAVPPLASAT